MNKAMIIGNVGKDPELKVTQSGLSTCKITIATSSKYTNKQGEKVENTEWHNVVFFAKSADTIAKYVQKGSKLYVEGEIRTRSWEDKDGVKRYSTEIIGQNFEFLNSRNADSRPSNPAPNNAKPHDDALDDIPF